MHYKSVRAWDPVMGSLAVGIVFTVWKTMAGFSPGVLSTLSSVTFLAQTTLFHCCLFLYFQFSNMPPPPLCTCGPCIYAHYAPHFVGLVPVYPLNLPLGTFNLQARCVSRSSKTNYNHSRSWKLTFIECLLSHSQISKHTTHINSFSAPRSLYFRIFSIIIVNFYMYTM